MMAVSTLSTHSARSTRSVLGRRATAGFTILEVMMAVIIISILTLILTPTLSNRAHEARLAACAQDMQNLADAQERAGIDMGYFLRIYALDDVSGGDDVSNNDYANNRVDGMADNAVTTDNIYETPTKIFITPSTQDYNTNYTALFARILSNETGFGFNGPYITWRRDENKNDWPEDPWGNDYLFFTRAGVIIPPNAFNLASQVPSGADPSEFFVTGLDWDGQTYDDIDTYFDRPTFLSLGPDGTPGLAGATSPAPETLFGAGDDLYYQFGGANYTSAP